MTPLMEDSMRSKIRLIFVSISILSLLTSVAAQRREIQPVEFKKLSDNLYEIHGGRGANGGFYVGDNGVLVIDAKMDQESVDQVLKGIQNLTDKQIKFLVNTHSDGDHITGNRFFPETVIFIAHENCRQDLFLPRRDGSPSEWNDPKLAPFIPSLTYTDKMDLYLGTKKVELWFFGEGHTTGDTVVFFPEEKIAFLGDQIFVGRPQLIHSYKGGNSFEHVKTLTKMLKTIDAKKFCSGHADVIDRETVKNHIIEMKMRQDKVKELKAQGKSLDEIRGAFPENESRLVESIYNEIK